MQSLCLLLLATYFANPSASFCPRNLSSVAGSLPYTSNVAHAHLLEVPRVEAALTADTFSPSLWENEEVQARNAIRSRY